MPLTMTAEREAEILQRITWWEPVNHCDQANEIVLELKAERAAHQETQAKLELRTGCAKCKGLGFTERHQPGHTHYETEGECPAYHFEKVPCISCGTGTVANNKQLAETQAITRELLEALEDTYSALTMVQTACAIAAIPPRAWAGLGGKAQPIIAKAKGVLPAGDTAGTGTW